MSNQRTIVLDSDIALHRVIRLCKQEWAQWLRDGKPAMELIVRLHQKARTVDQNSRMWKMLGLLESNGIICESHGRRMNAIAWHDYLRIKHGYVYGTRTIPIPDDILGGYRMIEAPNPQPTAKGAKGQMNKAEHSAYMERIHDELHDAGIQWDGDEEVAA